MKILITGITGYLGSRLALYLAQAGYTIHGLCRDRSKWNHPQHSNIRIFEGNLTAPKTISRAINGCNIVIHAAAYTKMSDPYMRQFYEVNVKGTFNVLTAAKDQGVDKLIFISSLSVLGPSLPNAPLREDQPRISAYQNHYELTKAMAEELVVEFGKEGLPFLILNLSRLYGPGKNTFSNGVNRFLAYIAGGKWVLLPDRLHIKANYLYIDDASKSIEKCLHPGSPENKRLILGGENCDYRTLIRTAEKKSARKARIIRLPYRLIYAVISFRHRVGKPFGFPGKLNPALLKSLFTERESECIKGRKLLQYEPIPLEKGIENTINYLNNVH